MANEYAVNQADLTAVADAIRAKGGTSGALAFPGGFVDAVRSIQAGGVNDDLNIGDDTNRYSFEKLFDVIEKNDYVTGTFVLGSFIPQTDTLVFSTGLEVLNGLMIVAKGFPEKTSGTDALAFGLWKGTTTEMADHYPYMSFFGFTQGKGTLGDYIRGRIMLNGTDVYAFCDNNWNNQSYTPLNPYVNYRWVAW